MTAKERIEASNALALREAVELSGLSQTAIANHMRQQGHAWHQQTVQLSLSGVRPLRLSEYISLREVIPLDITNTANSFLLEELTQLRRLKMHVLQGLEDQALRVRSRPKGQQQ